MHPHPLTARRGGPLTGRAQVPGDKSISIRALILGALAVGETRIAGMLEGEDALNTAKAMRALGAGVQRAGERRWRLHGVGVGGFAEPKQPLDFGNSGTGCRLALGAVAGCPITATFDGDASLRSRPMRRVLEPLERIGARALASADGRLPLTLAGARDPIPIVFKPPVPSAQLKSATLLAGLSAPGETTVIEAEATRDHTEKMLRHFGAELRVDPFEGNGRCIRLTGQPELIPQPVTVPADPSSSAFPLVAALLVAGSDVILSSVMMNPLRTGLFTTLSEMGASIDAIERRMEGGEEVADLRVRAGALRAVEVPAARAPSMIDEYPILAVAAATARIGYSSIIDGARAAGTSTARKAPARTRRSATSSPPSMRRSIASIEAPISESVVKSPVRSGFIITLLRMTSEPATSSAATSGNAEDDGSAGTVTGCGINSG